MDRQRQNLNQLVLSACALLACAHSPRTAADTSQGSRVAAPGPAATEYSTAVPSGSAYLDDDARDIERAISDAAARAHATLIGDPRLMTLASWVAEHLSPDGTLPMQAALDRVARHLGLAEPTPHVVVIASDDRSDVAVRLADDIVSLLGEHDYSHYGGATIERDGLSVYVIALSFRFIELDAVARSFASGSSFTIRGRLTHGFSAPELALTRPDGQVVRGADNAKSGSEFEFRVQADRDGEYRVEILGESALGITVVANFPVYVGQTADDAIELGAVEPLVTDPAEASAILLDMLNRERRKVGVPELTPDPQLAAIASAHNDDMLAHGFVGHTSKTTGTAGDRVVHAGIRTSLVLENIGRGYSLHEVHAGLMESPGHRGNLLHPQATHVGIAVSVRAEEGHHTYLVTELFIRVTPKLDAHAATTLLSRINRARVDARRHQLRSDPGLERIAARAAGVCFTGSGPNESAVMERVRAGLAGIGTGKVPVSALLSMTSSVEEIATIAALLEPNVSSIGIGLAQGERADTPPNTLCAVLLLAQ